MIPSIDSETELPPEHLPRLREDRNYSACPSDANRPLARTPASITRGLTLACTLELLLRAKKGPNTCPDYERIETSVGGHSAIGIRSPNTCLDYERIETW